MLKLDAAAAAKMPAEYLAIDIGHRLVIVAIVFLVLQTLFTSLFYISRYLQKTLNGWECWFLMPVAYVFSTAVCACSILDVTHGGLGRPVEAVLLDDPEVLVTRLKINKAVEYIDWIAITASKLVILSLYLRIFILRPYRIMSYMTGSVVILNWLAELLLSSTVCKPFSAQWNPAIMRAHCGDLSAMYTYITVPSILTDVVMLVLPLSVVWKLQVSVATKIGLVATFLIGSAGLIAAVLRFSTFLRKGVVSATAPSGAVINFSLVVVETGTYLIAACMPHLRPLKRRLFPEQSFTRLLDSVFQTFSVKTSSKSATFGKVEKEGVVRTTSIRVLTRQTTFPDASLQTTSTARLSDDAEDVFDDQRSPILPSKMGDSVV
ncbi:hypothetical protein BDV95DRAFT_578592 [Massariosphaeria phaeospora]|uniref:Rhodopsin domain-containing protein n=1 Tax=Massariosphaeria phaeospora TaxID=100035 RepID=A0A7C8MBQ9_9PLEO|nr:hypothetical protein BDV95DRAFT_578592 [Massariosphaeria phaeospora]